MIWDCVISCIQDDDKYEAETSDEEENPFLFGKRKNSEEREKTPKKKKKHLDEDKENAFNQVLKRYQC